MKIFARTVIPFLVASVFLCGAPTSPCSEKLATKNVIPARSCSADPSRYCFCLASWYGPKFFGRTLADGKKYARGAVFVAHKSLPFGTRLRIINLRKRRAIVAVVEDRGPYIPGRSLDLSYEAAKRLGVIQRGVIRVAYQVIPPS